VRPILAARGGQGAAPELAAQPELTLRFEREAKTPTLTLIPDRADV
jgi:hypothetical protein